jgi:predicted porin
VVDADGVAVMGVYGLSKRTSLFAAARKVSVDRADGSTTFEQTRHGVGVSHTF